MKSNGLKLEEMSCFRTHRELKFRSLNGIYLIDYGSLVWVDRPALDAVPEDKGPRYGPDQTGRSVRRNGPVATENIRVREEESHTSPSPSPHHTGN